LKPFIVALGISLLPIAANAIEKCGSGNRYTCVVDGDTIWLEGEKIRMMGYDTPEPQTNVCGGAGEVVIPPKISGVQK
jgi:micrococcal nuclease